jgi:hypothetical protein
MGSGDRSEGAGRRRPTPIDIGREMGSSETLEGRLPEKHSMNAVAVESSWAKLAD